MSRQISRRSAAMALAGISTVTIVALLAVPGAQAGAPSAKHTTTTQTKAVAAAGVLQHLGSRGSGSYYDARTGQMVVNVTNRADFAAVRAAGATPRLVRFSSHDLNVVRRDLAAHASIGGTTYGVDVRANKLRVTADSTVTRRPGSPRSGPSSPSSATRRGLETTAGALRTAISGGDAIYTSSARCSLGFNVRSNSGAYYFLTAGHCTNIGSYLVQRPHHARLPAASGTSFPGNDFGIVRYTTSNVSTSGRSGSQDIKSRRAPACVGATVYRAVHHRTSTAGRSRPEHAR